MGLAAWMTCLWPGLPRLWWRGQGTGFCTAAVFAIWLNFSLAATFLLPDRFPTLVHVGSWAGLAIFWGVCVRRGAGRLSHFYCGDGQRNDALFGRAQEEYLKGHWFEAESLLLRLVRDDPADVEGRLLLATLYRHTQRAALAQSQLDSIVRSPHAARWAWEIRSERAQLQRAADTPAEPAPEDERADVSGGDDAAEGGATNEESAGIDDSESNGGLSKAA